MKRFGLWLTIVILFSLPALVFAQSVGGTTRFGMVGVALQETLRLNVVAAYPPTPCIAQLGFRDANGQPQPNPDKTVNLQPGQAAFLDVSAASLGITFGHRVELRPIVSVMLGPNAAPSVCQANAEVFDSFSGRTSAWLPGSPAQ